ncbi:hypothetical protein QLL95_gp0624 [Cotonvirus japonicus]|uniref:Uncharacterized protein n=1 Tax=Cotonvirus japonicus TaxID=2811091 RepID=A0ABM7NTP2_9VIRU|nr:hypothetical protein QLL95_gp0624 [Cotonvirus japonicus]BCS83499.1 hypothetical protein [Cotonvirus japonicus]
MNPQIGNDSNKILQTIIRRQKFPAKITDNHFRTLVIETQTFYIENTSNYNSDNLDNLDMVKIIKKYIYWCIE